MRGTTVITGADGYVGRRLAAALAARGDDDLVLTVRAVDRAELAATCERLAHELGPDAVGRTRCVAADLRDSGPLTDVDTGAVTRIVHTAAVTRFNVEPGLARSVNVQGTARLAAFAARCDNLRRFAVLSTLYAAGRHQGDIKEERLDDAGFVNAYEWSKWAAEDQLLRVADLPVSILRLATLVADDDSGQVAQYNAFHHTLRLYYYGLLSLLPGDRSTPLALATASFTTAAIARLLEPDVGDGVYHICPDPADTATLGEVIDTAFGVFERDERFRRRGLLRPLPCDRQSFEELVSATDLLRAGVLHQSLASLAPFAAQLYLPKTFRNEALRAAWPDYAAPHPIALAAATCTRLVVSRWGRRSEEKP